jgi:hypothetical protein
MTCNINIKFDIKTWKIKHQTFALALISVIASLVLYNIVIYCHMSNQIIHVVACHNYDGFHHLNIILSQN